MKTWQIILIIAAFVFLLSYRPPAAVEKIIEVNRTIAPNFTENLVKQEAQTTTIKPTTTIRTTTTTENIITTTSTSTTTTTTTTNILTESEIRYMTYHMKIPRKYQDCWPLMDVHNQTQVDKFGRCILVNTSCCPCPLGYVDVINSKYYARYYEENLHNCSALGLMCNLRGSPYGCKYSVQCIGGLCLKTNRG